MKTNNKVIIHNWSIIGEASNSHKYKPKKKMALRGNVYNHPYHKNGTFVITSEIKSLNYEEKKASTINTDYILKDPDKKWLDWLNKNDYKLKDYTFSKTPLLKCS